MMSLRQRFLRRLYMMFYLIVATGIISYASVDAF